MSDGPDIVSIDECVRALDRRLRGHRRDKARLLTEVRDGLVDATVTGRSPEDALTQLGPIDDLVRACQPELTTRQVRRTAAAVVVTVPALIIFWQLLWGAQLAQLPRGPVLLGDHLAGAGAVTGLVSVLALLATGRLSRWVPVPRGLPLLTAVSGITGALVLATAPLVLASVSPPALVDWPSTLLGVLVAAVPLTVVAKLAWACRVCSAQSAAL